MTAPRPPSASAGGAEADLQWAIGAINHGQFEDAERFARRVLAGIPQHPKALYLLGYALLLQDRAALAVAPLEKAVRLVQDPAVETQLGIALRKVGRTDDALARLTRATKRRPAHPEAFHELGALLLSLDRGDEAATVIENGIRLAPHAVELLALFGVVQQSKGNFALAKDAFSRALAIAPDHPGARYGMGAVLMAETDYRLAADHFQHCVATNSGDVQARMKLGVCLLELGRTDEAIENFRLAVRGDASLYGVALKLVSSAGRGRFWLKPSAAAQMLR